MPGLRLAIVDDEQGICNVLGKVATDCGFDVFTSTSPSLFLRRARETDFDVVILDLHMPGVDGLDLLRELSQISSKARIVLASGISGDVMQAAFRLGQEHHLDMAGVIQKPIRLKDLRRLLQDLTPKPPETTSAG
jgi:CheY-like chemotaxis protein